MNIQIITKTFEYSNKNSILFPFLAFQKELNLNGIYIKVLFDIEDVKYSDTIILDSKYHRLHWIENEDKIYIDLLKLKEKTNKLIYFDTTDSTGMIQSEVFKYIDSYWKFQTLKDKSQYEKRFYGGRIFSDYYHNSLKIDDQNKFISNPLRKSEIQKIKCAWNFGLADYSYKNKYIFYLRKKFVKSFLFSFSKKKKFIKNNFLFAAFSCHYSRDTISYQRKKIKSQLNKYYLDHISEIKYNFLLSKSKYVISPFGWGELAYRDFDSFYNKCVLLKPNIDHLFTWPNFFIKNETFLDFSWDMSNLLDKIKYLEQNQNKYEYISSNGYENFHKYTTGKNAGTYFLNRLSHLLNE